MRAGTAWRGALAVRGLAAQDWLHGWWQMLKLGAVLLVLAMAPSSWRQPGHRHALARHVYLAGGPLLPGFTLLSALLSLVLIRIVLVTALSYGLSQNALEMLVRVLVLELIPLTAALYAALRATLPNSADIALLRRRGGFEALVQQGLDPLRQEVLPRVLAGMFAVALLAAVSCGLSLLLAYVSVHGFTLGGFERYTRTVGRVFNPAVSLIFALKLGFFSIAVALIPMASVLHGAVRSRRKGPVELQALVRMLLVLLVIEAASLLGNYY